MQSPETGLPKHRQSKLEKVFRIIDKSGTGRLSLRALQVAEIKGDAWHHWLDTAYALQLWQHNFVQQFCSKCSMGPSAMLYGCAAVHDSCRVGAKRHRRRGARILKAMSGFQLSTLHILVLQAYANSHGGETLTNADLRAIFKWVQHYSG